MRVRVERGWSLLSYPLNHYGVICSSWHGDETKNLLYDIINPHSNPYGRRYLDGSYNYPAGRILLTVFSFFTMELDSRKMYIIRS